MKLPNDLKIGKRLSKRVFDAKFSHENVIIKIFTLDDLESSAAKIKHVIDGSIQDETECSVTTLKDRILYYVNIHYIMQKKLCVDMSAQYYCQKTGNWEKVNIIENKVEENNIEKSKIPFVQLKYIIGLNFDFINNEFVFQNQLIGLVFPKLEGPIMSCTKELKWIVNSPYQSIFYSEKIISIFFKKIVLAVVNLYNNFNIVHKDIKIENICISIDQKDDDKFFPILIDFGESQLLEKNKRLRDAYGTHMMLPPEAFTSTIYNIEDNSFKGYDSEKREVWTLGCLLHILIFGYSPLSDVLFNKSPIYFQLTLCDQNQEISIPNYSELLKSEITSELKDLLSKMLNKNFNFRIKFDDIIVHPWFSN